MVWSGPVGLVNDSQQRYRVSSNVVAVVVLAVGGDFANVIKINALIVVW